MTLEKLQKDMIAAMKAHEKDRKEAISSLIGAVKKYAIDNGMVRFAEGKNASCAAMVLLTDV